MSIKAENKMNKAVPVVSSRVARRSISIPDAVKLSIGKDNKITIVGPKGQLEYCLHPNLRVTLENKELKMEPIAQKALKAISGTALALLSNMVKGVTDGFEKKLILVGVGYKAQAKDNKLSLALGFSHPVEYEIPREIKITTPTQTEVIVQGIDKQLVGQVAAEIRAYRSPEPYKGKGVKYADEQIVIKETKKK